MPPPSLVLKVVYGWVRADARFSRPVHDIENLKQASFSYAIIRVAITGIAIEF